MARKEESSMTNDDEYKHNFLGWGASDDCGGLSGALDVNGEDADEYDGCHNWFELKLDGKVIGECMMNYEGGWEFRFRSKTHRLEAGKLLSDWNGNTPCTGASCAQCKAGEPCR